MSNTKRIYKLYSGSQKTDERRKRKVKKTGDISKKKSARAKTVSSVKSPMDAFYKKEKSDNTLSL